MGLPADGERVRFRVYDHDRHEIATETVSIETPGRRSRVDEGFSSQTPVENLRTSQRSRFSRRSVGSYRSCKRDSIELLLR